MKKDDLNPGPMLKWAVANYAIDRIKSWADGKGHSMDCILPIETLFEDYNKVERMQILINDRTQCKRADELIEAIRARLQGEFDSPELIKRGPLCDNMHIDIVQWIKDFQEKEGS